MKKHDVNVIQLYSHVMIEKYYRVAEMLTYSTYCAEMASRFVECLMATGRAPRVISFERWTKFYRKRVPAS